MARWSWALAEDYGFRSSTHSSKWLVTHALETATSLASIGACTHVDIAAHTQINIILKNKKLLMVVFEVRALYSPGCPGPQTLRSSCLCLLSLYFYKMSVKWIKAVCFPCQKKKKNLEKNQGVREPAQWAWVIATKAKHWVQIFQKLGWAASACNPSWRTEMDRSWGLADLSA